MARKWQFGVRKPFNLFGLQIPNPIPGARRKSWAELHSFFDEVLRGGGAGKGTVRTQIEEYRSWVYSAISVIQRRVGEVDYKLFRSDTDEEVSRTSRPSKLIRGILETPNPHMNFRFLKQFVQIQLDLTGMGFILKKNDRFGLPLQLWPMDVNKFVRIEKESGYDGWIKGYTFNYGGDYVTFPTDQVLYFHYPHPEDPRVACSPIKAQAYAVDIDHYIEVYERDFFYNSARPDIVVQYPENVSIEEEDAKRFIEIWKQKFSGAGRYHEPSLLDKGAKVDILSPKGEDLGLAMLAEWSKDKVLAAYGVPEGKLGMSKDVNRANYVGIDITFNSECIKPRLKLFDDVITIGIARQLDPRLELRHNNPVPRDRELDIKEIKEKCQVPIWTINEARERDNLPPVPDGDKVHVPLNYMQLGSVLPQKPEPKPTDEGDTNEGPEPRKEIEKEEVVKKEIKSYPKDYLDKKWYSFKAYTENWERMFITRFAPLWEAQMEEVLQNLERYMDRQGKLLKNEDRIKESFTKRWDAFCRRYEGWKPENVARDLHSDNERLMKLIKVKDQGLMTIAVDGLFNKKSLENIIISIGDHIKVKTNMDDILFNFKNEDDKFSREAYKLEGTILVEKANEELASLGLEGNFTLENENAREWLGAKIEEFSNQILSTRVDQLRKVLREGFEKGESIRELSDRIQGVYGQVIKGWQAQRIARTEVISASNKGSYLGAKHSKLVKEKEWLSTRDQRTRGADDKDEADHYSMDGQRVKFEEPFRDNRTGAAMMFPGDSELGAGAEDVINCRCSFVNYTVSELPESEELIEPILGESKTINEAKELGLKYGLFFKDNIDKTVNNLTLSDMNRFSKSIGKIPLNILNKVKEKTIKNYKRKEVFEIFNARGITSHPSYKHLAGIQPRGWPKGSTWDDVKACGCTKKDPALYIPQREYGECVNIPLHEYGHVVDRTFGDITYTDEFINIWKKDLEITKRGHFFDAYFYNHRTEWFAEAFASYFESETARMKIPKGTRGFIEKWIKSIK